MYYKNTDLFKTIGTSSLVDFLNNMTTMFQANIGSNKVTWHSSGAGKNSILRSAVFALWMIHINYLPPQT